MPKLKSLFQSAKIGQVEVKNRLVMLSMGTGYGADDVPNQRWHDFYTERAKGGVGLMMVTVTPIPLRQPLPGVYDDRAMVGLRKLVDVAHRHGTKVGAQLVCLVEWLKPDGQNEYVGPSPVPATRYESVPRVLSVADIQALVEAFAEGTRRSREAGFDLIEFHFGMGYLVNRFISSSTNKREDQYGGSLEKRLRLPLEIIASAQQKVGRDYTMMCRISADEFMPGGHTLKETRYVAPRLVKAGMKALNVQAGWHQSQVPLIQASVPRGAYVYLAEAVKKMVDVPVVAAYRINDPVLADKIVAEGRADFVGMGRALIADSELPNKAKAGKFDDICPCIACSRCIEKALTEKSPLGCAVNARAGHEGEYVLQPASKPKKVFIIGGGPGGMETARIAAGRGHRVTLFDKGDKLGGTLLVAAIPPHKEELANFINYLAAQVNKTSAKVKLGEEVSAEAIISARPEVVIVATGATPLMPDIPGINGANVVTAVDVLKGLKLTGQRVLIIGGGMVGCETALFLASKGKQVIILEMLERIGVDIGSLSRWVMLKQLGEAGVVMHVKSKVLSISDGGVYISQDGSQGFLQGDTVVLAMGMKPNKPLAEKLQGKVASLHIVGDCVQPRRLGEAIEEGFNVGRQI